MLMFRFWSSDARGSDKTVETDQFIQCFTKPHLPIPITATITAAEDDRLVQPQKRPREGSDDSCLGAAAREPPLKRQRFQQHASLASPPLSETPQVADRERLRETILFEFGYEILFKHQELRFIEQELAKCQTALEQLRRCHLIPYPSNCPTPEQMLEISSGTGPAIQKRPGEQVPRWAPPFGVVDGPYARHYAKWLIPDPMFDGMLPEGHPPQEGLRSRASLEGRSTRNSQPEGAGLGKRPTRGVGSQKLHCLSSGYPQPKEKGGPCILKRSDGLTVKLACPVCHRENFSSTQGFINHCRIAHKRDFKSHEEAAVHCGQPIDVVDGGVTASLDRAPPSQSTQASGLVHPYMQADASEHNVYVALRSRIAASMKLFREGNLPGVASVPAILPGSRDSKSSPVRSTSFVPSQDSPYLSEMLRARNFSGDLRDMVNDAKTKEDAEDAWSVGDETDDVDTPTTSLADQTMARAPVVMRVPARTTTVPSTTVSSTRPASNKGPSVPHLSLAQPRLSAKTTSNKDEDADEIPLPDEDVDMDAHLSPNTLVSNNAPSLVSDDGEYDDSDEGSSESGVSDNLEAESVSDVAEITIEEESEAQALRHPRGPGRVGSGTAVRLRTDENKQVTFVTSVKNTENRRGRKV